MKTILLICTFLFLFLSGCATTITTPADPSQPSNDSSSSNVVKPSEEDGLITISYAPKKGQSGGNVEVVQAALNAHGAKLKGDGLFGPATEAAIKAFQKSQGLTADGILGEKTLKALGIKVGIITIGGIPVLSWEVSSKPERRKWTEALISELRKYPTTLDKASGVEAWCPRYKSLSVSEKEYFWGELTVVMATHESGHDRFSTYMEPPPLNHESLGLMQLSYAEPELSLCGVKKSSQDLYDGPKNLICTVRLFAKYIEQDRVLATGYTSAKGCTPQTCGRGLARYWAVMRTLKYDKNKKQYVSRESYSSIKTHTNRLPICYLGL